MAHLHLSWWNLRFGSKRNRATGLQHRQNPGDESGYWALVDATLRGTGIVQK